MMVMNTAMRKLPNKDMNRMAKLVALAEQKNTNERQKNALVSRPATAAAKSEARNAGADSSRCF